MLILHFGRMYIEEQAEVPWETLNVQVSDIIYGGRVTDIWDKRSISSLLRRYSESIPIPCYCTSYYTMLALYYFNDNK